MGKGKTALQYHAKSVVTTGNELQSTNVNQFKIMPTKQSMLATR